MHGWESTTKIVSGIYKHYYLKIYFMKNIYTFILLAFLVFFSSPAMANNLVIANVSLEERTPAADTVVVEFDISWDNSWRNDINHDAVWVFCKIYDSSDTTWKHAYLATSGLNPADIDPGSNTGIDLLVPTDNAGGDDKIAGVFIRPKNSGTGTVASNNVRLTIDYSQTTGLADTDDITVKVFGVEMVYIPQDSFNIGDDTNRSGGTNSHFWDAGDSTDPRSSIAITGTQPYLSELADGTGTAGDITWLDEDGGTGDCGALPGSRTQLGATFPTGFDAFYSMKYEITQGQYRDFLNTLSAAQQANRVVESATENDYAMTSAVSVTTRDTIKLITNGTPDVYKCDLDDDDVGDEYNDGEGIVMNYMNWQDLCAYADWAGLRPITELEYEKIARGPTTPVASEYPWGSTAATQAQGAVQNSGEAAETANTTGNGLYNSDAGGGTDIVGPLRSGFAATGATTRIQAGAGYYGNMELAGNVVEMVVSVGHATGLAFTGTHGDGEVTTTTSYEGYATNADWPGIDGTPARGVTGATGSGYRGGGTSSTATARMMLSDRYYAGSAVSSRGANYGGRLARNAPAE